MIQPKYSTVKAFVFTEIAVLVRSHCCVQQAFLRKRILQHTASDVFYIFDKENLSLVNRCCMYSVSPNMTNNVHVHIMNLPI